MWLFLWFLLSVVILGTTVWSTIILVQQKQAWKEYAQKKGLVFTANKFLEPCSMEGVIDSIYQLSFFTATQVKEDSRKNRQITVLQVNVESAFTQPIAMGTTEMHLFIQSLEDTKPFKVENKSWSKDYLVRVNNSESAGSYLTDERLKILDGVLKMPNADILIILNEKEGIFRFETSNPLKDAKQIDSIVTKLIKRVEKLKSIEG